MTDSSAPVSTRAVLSLVCAILATTGWCPCAGSLAAILLGMGETSAVGRVGFHLGWISLAMTFLALALGLVFLAGAVLLDALN